MTMNRVIHHAVRRDLTRAEEALRAMPEGDRQRAEEIKRAWEFLRAELTRHHVGEDTIIWPVLERLGAEPALLKTMESEHEAMAEALAAASSAVDTVASQPDRARAEAAADAVAHANEVTAAHLAHEETELEPQLAPHVETEEWKAAEKQLRKAGPVTAGQFFAWLQDGMTPEGRAFLSSTVPAPVTFLLGRVFGLGYHRRIAPVWRG